MKTNLELSENGWEYIGSVTIDSKEPPVKINDTTIKVDGVVITFDEEVNIVGV